MSIRALFFTKNLLLRNGDLPARTRDDRTPSNIPRPGASHGFNPGDLRANHRRGEKRSQASFAELLPLLNKTPKLYIARVSLMCWSDCLRGAIEKGFYDLGK
jgi:hypothetical protein